MTEKEVDAVKLLMPNAWNVWLDRLHEAETGFLIELILAHIPTHLVVRSVSEIHNELTEGEDDVRNDD